MHQQIDQHLIQTRQGDNGAAAEAAEIDYSTRERLHAIKVDVEHLANLCENNLIM